MTRSVWQISPAIVALIASGAAAQTTGFDPKPQRPAPVPSTIALAIDRLEDRVPPPPAVDVLDIGFENAEGYNIGPISGQQTWATFPGEENFAQVLVANPAPGGGSQHVRLSDGKQGIGASAFSPDLGAQPLGIYTLTMDVALNDDQGADYDVVAQSPDQAFISARVKFRFDGDIWVQDDVGGIAFVDTGIDWTPGSQYRELKIVLDAFGDTIDYYFNGALIYQSQGGVYAGTTFEQVVLLADEFQSESFTAVPAGDFDNILITYDVPTPGALALLGLAAGAWTRRRRRA